MISLLYECALWLFAMFVFPKMLFDMWSKGKYKKSFWQKLGFKFPVIDKRGRSLIWVHVVSVGETKAVSALVKKIKNGQAKPLILVTSSTETGHAEAKKSMAFADHHAFLPFDFSWIIKPIIRRIKPNLIILCETDWWYNFLHCAKENGACVVVVNGKISERSTSRFNKIPFFTKKLFDLIDLLCVQSSHYLHRFEKLGIDKKRLVVTGNIKFDDDHHKSPADVLQGLRARLALNEDDEVVVIGSTHNTEEVELLNALHPLWEKHPCLKVLVVPRHPERFDEVASIIHKMGLKLHRYTSPGGPKKNAQVVLVDAMGVLRLCYQLATVAVVAGSFTGKVGGHNILEPLYYDVPVVFGPYMFGQPELLDLVLEHEAGLQAKDSASVGEAVALLLENRSLRCALIEKGRALVKECRGATEHTHKEIERFFADKCK